MTSSSPNPTSSSTLWERIRARDPDAEEEFVERVNEVCRKFSRNQGLSAAKIDELQNRVSGKVWELASGQAETPRNLEALIHFKAMGELTAMRREQGPTVGLESEPIDPKSSSRPAAMLTKKELSKAIWDCVNELRYKYRRAWLARCRDDMSVPQIAEMLGVKVSAIPVWFFRSKDALVRCLRRKGVVDV